eukprot:augustus_masked-scaffold_2-processed-gene-9.9-mRNA-1 protein AED:0.23 eAED:0.24 QI:0/-1/0/1/-1/1/1/0/587
MKLTLRWEEGDESLHTTLKITLPKGWKDGPTSRVKETFVDGYNKKFPQNKLDFSTVHLVNPKGEQLADDDVVLKVLDPSDTVRVKYGKPPATTQKTVKPAEPTGSGRVTTAAELEKVKEADKFAFDYSKWDRLDLSDDDGNDCHPNIDLESWKRLMGRQRSERREAEDRKIQRYNAKIDKYTKKSGQLEKKLKKLIASDNKGEEYEEKKTQLEVDLEDAKTSKKEYEYKLNKFLNTRKLVADDVCEVKESKGLVVDNVEYDYTTSAPDGEIKPQVKRDEDEGKETSSVGSDRTETEKPKKKVSAKPEVPKNLEYNDYESFQRTHRNLLNKFAVMKSDVESEDFLLKYPSLLCEHAEGFLLILTLDTCIKHQLLHDDPTKQQLNTPENIKKHEEKEYIVAKQHLTIHYINELGKSLRRKAIEAVKPFFRKTGPKAEDRVQGFKEDLDAFIKRIRNRAKEKIGNGEIRPLVDPESSLVSVEEIDLDSGEVYQKAPVGPGGLDPNEVLSTLPEVLQDAFISQDMQKLVEGFESLSPEEGEYHLQRCIDSGLWVPGNTEEEEEQEEVPVEAVKPPEVESVSEEGPTIDDIE